MSNAPFTWTPTNATPQGAAADIVGVPLPGGQVDGGDWVQVFVSFRGVGRVAYAAQRFLMHVIYTPNSDDALSQLEQATTYGGSQSGTNGFGANRRRNYHVDINYAFQVPFRGTISITAGDVSDPAVLVDVLLVRGHTPRDSAEQAEMLHTAHEMQMAAADPIQYEAASFYAQLASQPPRKWAPPVVGPPGLVPSTWVDIPNGTAIPFPDGAVRFETTFVAAAVVAPPQLNIVSLGNALTLDLPGSGLPISVAAFTGGAATTLGVRSTWAPNGVALKYATIWSMLGG